MNKEIKLEVLLFLFAGICCFYLIPEFTPDVPSANDLGPRMFPRLSMAVVGLSALGLIVNSFRQKTKTEDKQEKTNNRYLAAFVGVKGDELGISTGLRTTELTRSASSKNSS